MKLFIQKTNHNKKVNVVLLEIISTNLLNNTITYHIKDDETPVIKFTDTGELFLIKNLAAKYINVPINVIVEVVASDLLLIKSATQAAVQTVTGDSVNNTDPLNVVIDAVSLAGTTTNKPITGSIETSASAKALWVKGANHPNDYHSITAGSGHIGLNFKNTVTNYQTTLSNENGNITLNSTFPGARGIQPVQDFSANITALDYTQKVYVDAPSTQTQTQRSTSTSGTEITSNNGRNLIYIHEAGLTTTLTINLPNTPVNNQIVTLLSVGGITTLTLSTLIGTILGAITTLAAGGSVRYIWLASQSKWYKL